MGERTNLVIMNLLKKFGRELVIGILLIVCCISFRTCSVKDDDIAVLKNVNDSAFNVAHYYFSKNGELVGQVKTHELTIKQWKKYGAQLGFDVKDLKGQVGRSNRLVAHWKGKAGMKGGTVVIALKDTTIANSMDDSFDMDAEPVKAKAFEWSNKFLSLNGLVDLDSNKLALKYQYETDFSITAYYKAQGLFKKPQLVTDIWFEDDNMKVREFKGFVVKQPKKRFFQRWHVKVGIGIGIGYGLTKLL